MKIIVIGCGKIGLSLVKQLTSEGHIVTVIDKNSNRLKNALSNLDVMSFTGDGTSSTTLREAGIGDADLMVAVMDSDEMNLLCCVIAQKVGKCKTIARVRNPIYNSEIEFLKNELDISMIFNPEMTAA
ncbi:MAG: NAD-binding protein, partial [Lachnospiraceae bacterium]|nr:NAD-binding protein [Lachnospiraceae bacterium]